MALFNRENRLSVLDHFIMSTRCEQMKSILLKRLKDPNTRSLVTNILNEPTLEALKVLEVSGVPSTNTSVVFNTTATANSGNDNAIMAAFKILGIDNKKNNIVLENCSTCTKSGFTGVSYVRPKHTPVTFDPNTPLSDWKKLSENLGNQLFKISTGKEYHEETYSPSLSEKYSHIYHWGCISQNWQRSPLGHYVSSWKLHEKWNLLFTMAMMWHAIATLQQGGQLCLKVRIMRSAETLGLVSLLSPLFESVRLLDNARQQCSFSVAVYSGFKATPEIRLEMMTLLRQCMNFEPSTIFYNRFQREYPECRATSLEAERIREIMMVKRAETNTIYLACLDCARQFLERRNKRIMYDTALPLLIETYGEKFGMHLFDSLMIACKRLSPQQQQLFITVMNTEWMHDNV